MSKEEIYDALKPILQKYEDTIAELRTENAKLLNENRLLKKQNEEYRQFQLSKPAIKSESVCNITTNNNTSPKRGILASLDLNSEVEWAPITYQNDLKSSQISDYRSEGSQESVVGSQFEKIILETDIGNSEESPKEYPGVYTPKSIKKRRRASSTSSDGVVHILNIDQITARIKDETVIDLTRNPLSGKRWVLEDFKLNTSGREELLEQDFVINEVWNSFMQRQHALSERPCEQCLQKEKALGYGYKAVSPGWDETLKSQKFKPVVPKEIVCTHRNVAQKYKNLENSPPGFFNAKFPDTQELEQEKLRAKLETNKRTLQRFLAATSRNPAKRVFVFRNQVFNNVVDSGFYSYSTKELGSIYL